MTCFVEFCKEVCTHNRWRQEIWANAHETRESL